MATIQTDYRALAAGYLFPEISRRAATFLQEHPNTHLYRLGIGNTTEALSPTIVEALHHKVDLLSDRDTYTGYGDEQGDTALRVALQQFYHKRGVTLEADEFFISDGAKSDAAHVQSLFGTSDVVAVQDPAYPVYVDSNVVVGRAGTYEKKEGKYNKLVYLPATEENDFFPELPKEKVDIIYLCSPNNPTGAVATHEQLQQFVDYAKRHKAVIIFDAAYSEFISDDTLPRSIYEIEGAKECAIEINSFSKFAGFTGVRLGWSIVPKHLVVENSEVGEIHTMWFRHQVTFFNGASNISQAGGLAALTDQGLQESHEIIAYYMENATMIKEALESLGLTVYGGTNAPYVWVKTPNNLTSWEFFDQLLHQCHVLVTPGSGFGSSGEHYIRISAFGHKEQVALAVQSITENLQLN
ncbi:MAG: LL-diaminopimelate aminotransferase [Sphaerochaetaceae bacterium]|jgi:LL-diaminopimelate aminotransferase